MQTRPTMTTVRVNHRPVRCFNYLSIKTSRLCTFHVFESSCNQPQASKPGLQITRGNAFLRNGRNCFSGPQIGARRFHNGQIIIIETEAPECKTTNCANTFHTYNPFDHHCRYRDKNYSGDRQRRRTSSSYDIRINQLRGREINTFKYKVIYARNRETFPSVAA